MAMVGVLPKVSGNYRVQARFQDKKTTFTAYYSQLSGHWYLGDNQIGCYRDITPPGEDLSFLIDSVEVIDCGGG